MCVHKLNQLPTLEVNYESDNCSYEDVNKSIKCDSGDLGIIHLNVRGLNSKIGNLNYLLTNSLSTSHPDIVLLCETWLNKRSPKPVISGYNIERTDRINKKGGGVSILISNRCRYKRRKDLEESNAACFESCFIELENQRTNLIIGSIYRPPNTDSNKFNRKFERLTNSCIGMKKHLIIGLDHNLDLLKANHHCPTQDFLELIYTAGLVPKITKPTRITSSTATLIDNILINQQLDTNSTSGILVDNVSDHLPCYTIIPDMHPSKRKAVEITSRDTRPKNIAALKKFLSTPGTLLPLDGLTASQQFDNFHDCLQKAVDHFLPTKTRKIPSRLVRQEPWVTSGLFKCIKKSKQLYRKTLNNRTDQTARNKYTEYNNLLQKIKRNAKKNYYIDQCINNRSNTAKLWRTINFVIRKTQNKSEIIDKLKINNLDVYKGELIAEEFARYFSNIGKEYATKMPKSKKDLNYYLNKIPRCEMSIFLHPVTEAEVSKLIDKLEPKKSSGYDNINNVLLKELKQIVSRPLTTIFNNSMVEGIFPDKMKKAKVIPLHKGKNRDETTNYRPISLLLTMSKILEKIMHVRVYKFLCDTKQLYASQYGFRKHHACDQAVGELVAVIAKGMQQKKLTAGVFLDLSKAFDSLELSTTFKKMEKYGLRGCCLSWFKSYLTDRKMSVSCKTSESGDIVNSEEYEVDYGTPQGSVLGPLIFLIFCNDLHLHLIFLSCIQFADDTTLYVSHTSIDYIRFCLEHDLEILHDWFLANKLTLNINKSTVILFGNHGGQKLKVHIDSIAIPQSTCTKFLGIWIDEHLTWCEHTNRLLLKLNANMNLLKMGQNFLNQHALKVIYFAQIHSNLSYGIGIWGSLIPKDAQTKLQKLQTSCLKTMTKSRRMDHTDELKILNVEQLIHMELCKVWHKRTLGLLPNNLEETMGTDQNNKSLNKKHNYETRQKKLQNRPNSTVRQYHESFLVKGNRFYSQLPLELHQVKCIKKFCRSLKKTYFQ